MGNETLSGDSLKAAVLEICVKQGEMKVLPCEAAHDLAKNSKFTLKEIGALCDDEDIRIVKCELGCF